MSHRKLWIGMLLACMSLTAQTRDPHQNLEHGREFLGLAPPPDPAAAARGKTLFAGTCGFCHGANATGAEAPDLLRSPVVLHDERGNELQAFLAKGRPDRGMPAFPNLTQAQVYDIAEFLHARVEEAANRWGYKMQNVVTGNADAGQKFFTAHCTSCHSTAGDLAHIASKYDAVTLQSQFLYPSSSRQPVTASITLASGEEVKGVLTTIDDFEATVDGRTVSLEGALVKIHDPLQGHRELLPLYTNSDMHNVLTYLVTLK